MALTKVKLISDGVITVDNLNENHGITTTHIGEGDKLFYTDARVQSYLSANDYATIDGGYFTNATLSANILTFDKSDGTTDTVDLSLYLDDTNLARLVSGTLDALTGVATFTRDDSSTFTIDFSAFLSDANDYVSSGSFNTATGVLTLTRLGGATVTIDLDGKYAESVHTHIWTDITDRPTALSSFTNDLGNYGGFLTSVSWDSVNDKPLTFPPGSHDHDDRYYTETESDSRFINASGDTMTGTLTLASISGDGMVENAYGNYLHLGGWAVARTDATAVLVNTAYRADYADNLFDMNISRFTNDSGYLTSATKLVSPNGATVVAADSALPDSGHSFIHTLGLGPGGNDGHILGMTWANTNSIYGAQIFVDTDPTNTMAFRSRSNAGVWTEWNTVVHSGNIGSQSVSYASNAGTLDSIDSSQFVRNDVSRAQVAGYMDTANITNGAFRVYDGSTFRGGFGTATWADGSSPADVMSVYSVGDDIIFYTSSAKRANINSNGIYAYGFYDLNSTGYYLDPSSTGVSLRAGGNVIVNGAFGTDGYGSGSLVGRVYGPKGATYSSGVASVTGAIKIRLPIRANDTMWSMKVRIYNYTSNDTSEYLIGNYSYSAGAWNYGATYYGSQNSRGLTVRFGNEGGYDCVWIGETSTAWAHPVVSVMDFMGGYSNGSALNWDDNWDITFVTSFGTIGASIVPNIRFSTVYVDGNIRNNGSVEDNDGFGIYWDSGASTAYAIYREAGSWSDPYPDLRIAFHTGIKLGANASYNGIRFYTDYDMSAQVMSINNASDGYGAGHVHVNGIMNAGDSHRAPVFYDSNDTGYYLDPTGTSRLNTIVYNNLKWAGDQSYGFFDRNVYADTINGRGSDPLELNYYDGGDVKIGSGVNGSKALYAGALYDAGSRVAISRGEGTSYVEHSRYVYNNGAYSGSGWIEPSDLGVRYANSSNYSNYLATAYVGGQQLNPQVYFNNGVGLRVAMTASWGYWSDTMWVNGYAGGDVPWMCALHFQRNSQPRIAISAQQTGSTSYGTLYELWSSYNMDAPNKSGTSYYQTETWMQFNGGHGLYWPNNYGAHFYPNNNWTYCQFRIDGSKNGYGGIVDSYSAVNGMMYDSSGNGGIYREANGRWYLYHHIGNNCTSINTSTGSSSYGMYVDKAIYSTGDIIAYSDRRKKTDIVTIENALDKVKEMRGVFYTKIGEEEKGRNVGVIAQEMNEVLPEVVTYAEDIDEYGVAYGNIVGVLIEAIKEQQKQIDELKAIINGTT